MSSWQEFLRLLNLTDEAEQRPGPIMISFLNRYLEPLDSIKYQIEYDDKKISGLTTRIRHTVEIKPLSFRSVKVYVWSRAKQEFKLIDEITPVSGKRLLINERLKTYKHKSDTELHPQTSNNDSSQTPKSKEAPKKPTSPVRPPQGVEPVKTTNKNAEPEHQTNRGATDKIQVAQLKKIFPAAEESYLGQVADELNTDLEKYKLDTTLRRAHFFAQVRQEAGAKLSPKQENLNYRPEVLISKFSYYGEHRDEAEKDGRLERIETVEKIVKKTKKEVKVKTIVQQADQEAIANKAYGGRSRNGPASTGDGWRFRGRGIFQLTLRATIPILTMNIPRTGQMASLTSCTARIKSVNFHISSAPPFGIG